MFLLPFYIATSSPAPPTIYTWCTFQMIQVNSKEMISAAYGMGNVPTGIDLNGLCQAFYTRDIRAEDKPLELVSSVGAQNTSNPDAFWLANTWRRKLTPAEIEQYDCLINKNGGLALSAKVLDFMPTSPNSIRIPALMLNAIQSINSPIIRYAASVMYTAGLPIMLIAALVKAWKLARK
ncbi:MAG: hypothetical protein EAZ09_06760 [Oscillatoriales cyanobacterium]|nr:MAG: hypothetical protein EAZ18_05785 [Oscillatoriales cyanobacterium]TAH23543.1 MAG: hypothetical protein EAZ09_06760 [Oscillatoriales cyanobacterium]